MSYSRTWIIREKVRTAVQFANDPSFRFSQAVISELASKISTYLSSTVLQSVATAVAIATAAAAAAAVSIPSHLLLRICLPALPVRAPNDGWWADATEEGEKRMCFVDRDLKYYVRTY